MSTPTPTLKQKNGKLRFWKKHKKGRDADTSVADHDHDRRSNSGSSNNNNKKNVKISTHRPRHLSTISSSTTASSASSCIPVSSMDGKKQIHCKSTSTCTNANQIRESTSTSTSHVTSRKLGFPAAARTPVSCSTSTSTTTPPRNVYKNTNIQDPGTPSTAASSTNSSLRLRSDSDPQEQEKDRPAATMIALDDAIRRDRELEQQKRYSAMQYLKQISDKYVKDPVHVPKNILSWQLSAGSFSASSFSASSFSANSFSVSTSTATIVSEEQDAEPGTDHGTDEAKNCKDGSHVLTRGNLLRRNLARPSAQVLKAKLSSMRNDARTSLKKIVSFTKEEIRKPIHLHGEYVHDHDHEYGYGSRRKGVGTGIIHDHGDSDSKLMRMTKRSMKHVISFAKTGIYECAQCGMGDEDGYDWPLSADDNDGDHDDVDDDSGLLYITDESMTSDTASFFEK